MHRREQGFSVVETVLVLVVLGLLGFTGWFVWHSKQAADKSLNSANKTSQGKVQASAVKDFEACKKAAGSMMQETYPEVCVTKDGKRFTDPSQSLNYLVIKEWKVKIPLGANIIDAYYYISPDLPSAAYLSLGSLKNTDCRASSTSLAGISRIVSTEINESTGRTVISEHPDAVKVGDYYYFAGYPQAGCDTSPASIPGDVSLRSEFAEAIKGIQAE
jgi:hypothetical protein